MSQALQRAIEMVGGPSAMSRHIGIARQAISKWDICPVLRVLAVSRATEGRIRPSELRPDYYPPGECS